MSPLEKFRAILLFGPPGSGKGSVGKVLSFLQIGMHISSGDLFRSLPPQSKMGKLFREKEELGLLVPDEISITIFEQHLERLARKHRLQKKEDLLILDGIPRTEKQVDLLQKNIEVKNIFYLHVQNTDTLVKRIGRRAKAQKRTDDQNRAVIQTRIREYEEKTASILKKYPSSLITTIYADQRLANVLQTILNLLLNEEKHE